MSTGHPFLLYEMARLVKSAPRRSKERWPVWADFVVTHLRNNLTGFERATLDRLYLTGMRHRDYETRKRVMLDLGTVVIDRDFPSSWSVKSGCCWHDEPHKCSVLLLETIMRKTQVP